MISSGVEADFEEVGNGPDVPVAAEGEGCRAGPAEPVAKAESFEPRLDGLLLLGVPIVGRCVFRPYIERYSRDLEYFAPRAAPSVSK